MRLLRYRVDLRADFFVQWGLTAFARTGSLVAIGDARLLTGGASRIGSVEVAVLDGLAAEAGEELGKGYRSSCKLVEGKKRQ